MRVTIPTAAFARYCAETALAEVAESRAAEQRRQLERRDLAADDREFLQTAAEHNAAMAKALRDKAEVRRRGDTTGEVVQLDQRARARAEAGR